MVKPADKIRVAVLFGGRSGEHEVSLRSAANVIQHLDKSLFDVIPVGIDRQGNWFLEKDIFTKSLEQNAVSLLEAESKTWFTPAWVNKTNAQAKKEIGSQKTSESSFDVIFPAVHGTFCEDGTLQGLLELAGIPYVGCGVLASAIGMEKDVSKRLVNHAGISVGPYLVIKQDQWQANPKHYVQQIEKNLNYPVFVKPVNAGSSVGISKVKNELELNDAIHDAFRFDTKIIIEKALSIIELEVAVLESLESNKDPIASIVGEIKPNHEFYSYDAKYIDENGADLFIPARISDVLQQKAQQIAKQIFLTLECEGMARVDLFLDKESNQIYFNEINTLPGFTQISMYPKLMNASGISYPELLTHLIQLAIRRHKNKNQLIY